jgi:hypothetical protein
MIAKHLTPGELDSYVEREIGETARAAIDRHLSECASCRARAERLERMEAAIRDLPREKPLRNLTTRILAAVDWRSAQEETKRQRAPIIALAMVSSLLLSLWLGGQMVIAFQENGALDFFSLFTSRPDILSADFSDALFVLLESLPILEIVLTLFALVTVIVLAQQLMDSVQPRVAHLK